MLIDMHCHSLASDDARATVEQYLKWIAYLRQGGHTVDGIVLTEHRQFDPEVDYSELGAKYGVVVLKGAELDTRYGHMLVYGVNRHLLRRFDPTDVTLDGIALMREARASGAIVIPAHPGRRRIGLCDFIDTVPEFGDIDVVEVLNGGSRPEENQRAQDLARRKGYRGIGGSDAHFVSAIGACLTEFPDGIRNEEDLVEALNAGQFRALWLGEARRPAGHDGGARE